MVNIVELRGYTIPMFGNKRLFPYGNLVVTDGQDTKTVAIKEDGEKQYFTFKRKRYYVNNEGSLYAPKFTIKKED